MSHVMEPGVFEVVLVSQKYGHRGRVFSYLPSTGELVLFDALGTESDQETDWFWGQSPEGPQRWRMTLATFEPLDVSDEGEVNFAIGREAAQIGEIRHEGLPALDVVQAMEAVPWP